MTGAGFAHVVVVVPARNEARRIGACVASLHAARRHLDHGVKTSLVLVADACTDDTVAISRSLLRPSDRVIEVDYRSAGAARRIGTSVGATLIGDTPPHHTWLATTDADSVVPPNWLSAQLDLARTGVIGVAGTVSLDEEGSDRLHTAFGRYYRTGRGGTHGHVHGANLGSRLDACLAVGGWTDLVTGEDHDLWGRLRHVGPVVSTTAIPVITSARLRGRAPDGFSADLAMLDESA